MYVFFDTSAQKRSYVGSNIKLHLTWIYTFISNLSVLHPPPLPPYIHLYPYTHIVSCSKHTHTNTHTHTGTDREGCRGERQRQKDRQKDRQRDRQNTK